MVSYEKIFLWIALSLLALFLAAITYSAFVMHIALPSSQKRIIPKPGEPLAAAVLRTPPFNHPGVREVAPGKYLVVVLGQIWTFTPREIDLPAGADVTFEATSLDITHGFFIPGTRVNMMLIPGYISVEKYRFKHPGNYVLLCHEYCGLLHQTMMAKVVVK